MEKNYWLIFAFLALFSSCQTVGDENLELEKVVETYVTHIDESNDRKDEILVKVRLDSSNYPYEGYRISTTTNLLEQEELPSKFDIHHGVKVAYFLGLIDDSEEKTLTINELTKQGFYRPKDRSFSLSNYPEWVILVNRSNGKKHLIKD